MAARSRTGRSPVVSPSEKSIASPVESACKLARWASTFEATDLVVSPPSIAWNGTEASTETGTFPLGKTTSVRIESLPGLSVRGQSRSCSTDPAVISRTALGSTTGHHPDHDGFVPPISVQLASTPPRS